MWVLPVALFALLSLSFCVLNFLVIDIFFHYSAIVKSYSVQDVISVIILSSFSLCISLTVGASSFNYDAV